jgi:Tfp pilus assembly protein PilO
MTLYTDTAFRWPMFKSFKDLVPFAKELAGKQAGRGTALYFEVAVGVLLLLNALAIYFYFAPPGGSRADLAAESTALQRSISVAQKANQRLTVVSGKVQLASQQTSAFEDWLFLPRRNAYERVVSEIQRLTKVSGITERDGTYAEEPIEGSRDLTLVSFSVNLDGTYPDLMHFLNELDHSPALLILDSLNAAPLQSTGHLNLSAKFLAVLREDPALLGVPVIGEGAGQ